MGAVFSLNIVEYPTIKEYINSNNFEKFFFMLNGKKNWVEINPYGMGNSSNNGSGDNNGGSGGDNDGSNPDDELNYDGGSIDGSDPKDL